MTGFSAEWLSLREPFDNRARNADVLKAALASLAHLPSVNITDLACGTGSTFRSIAPHIAKPQSWRLVDNDLSLLARAGSQPAIGKSRVATLPVDLAHDVEAALDGVVDLVTTSALLDLVSAEWLERLATEIATRRLPFYAALSYDGKIALEPPDRSDRAVVEAVNRHQRNDKGFGPALGPEAARAAVERFETVGYTVVQGQADWIFGPEHRVIQSQTIAGWAMAAAEISGFSRAEAADWLSRRQQQIEAGTSQIVVGHVDFVALPPRLH